MQVECEHCVGTGEVEMLWLENKWPTIERCTECDGTGMVESEDDGE